MKCAAFLFILLLPVVCHSASGDDFPYQASSSACDIGGTWSTWKLGPNQDGYDYCGSCWKVNWIRECLSLPDCPCNGPTEFKGEMNIERCIFPRFECCPGYVQLIANGVQACVNVTTNSTEKPPVNETPLPNDTYCPPSGVGIWGSWSNWGSCTESCGQFGTRKRTRNCTSETYGCPCFKSDVGPCQTASCPGQPCSEPTLCNGALVTSVDGNEKYCSPFQKPMGMGTWSEWSDVFPPFCNETCGMYGRRESRRACFPPGSVCPGSVYTSIKDCPPYPVCYFPLIACKSPYKLVPALECK